MDRRPSIVHRSDISTTLSKLSLFKASTLADRAWMAEVTEIFGARDSGMARAQDRASGAPGTKLRELYDAYVAARDAYAILAG